MATQSTLVDNDGFTRLIEESPEARPYEMGGYLYLTRREKNGWQTYRTYGPKWAWLYQARRILTMAAGGGAELIILNITPAAGQVMKLVSERVIGPASAASTLTVALQDEDGAAGAYLAVIGAGASREARLPSIGTTATGTSNIIHSLDLLIGPGQVLTHIGSAAANGETLTVGITLLLSTPTVPTWSSTGSGGAPTLASSTISDVNTLQAVLLP